jgi:hypothetical protein
MAAVGSQWDRRLVALRDRVEARIDLDASES